MSNKTDRIQVTTEMAIAARTYIETHRGWRFKEAIEAALDVHYNKLQCEEDAANKPEQCCAKCGSLRLEPVDGQAQPTFEGDEAEVMASLELMSGIQPGSLGKTILALLDAKDAKLRENEASWRDLSAILAGTRAERDAALSRAERAENERENWRRHATYYQECLEKAEQALAEERKAHQAFREEVDAKVRAWQDAGQQGPYAIDDAVDGLHSLILPAKPAVDPLVAVLNAAGYAVFPEDLERVRAAIERAGGVKAVFGEGLE